MENSHNDLAHRFSENPLLVPADVSPSSPGMIVECLLNPGVFTFRGETWLLVRVAECPEQCEDSIRTPVFNDQGQIEILEFQKNDPKLDSDDPRVFSYDGESYLTTLSHLLAVPSPDGRSFDLSRARRLFGATDHERYGIEDCRVTQIGETYYLTYTAVSAHGVAVGLMETIDWETFTRRGIIIPPHNKDCTFFPEKINGKYYCLHRPSGSGYGGNFVWIGQSPDGEHWGNHRCLAKGRKGRWDCARVGCGSAPIKTDQGWIALYHGSGPENRYCLGAFLLDLEDPSRLIARSKEPIMEPLAAYEQEGFFGNVVFQNGHIQSGDTLTIYYGASDSVVCGATLSIQSILAGLESV